MSKDQKRIEREARALRLVQARKDAGFTGPKDIDERLGWNVNNYKAHESARNGFDAVDGKRYAKAFKVSLRWLMLGEGDPGDTSDDPIDVIDVPLVSWVSAGELGSQDAVVDLSEYPVFTAVNLPDGDWIGLRVDGPSMNKISPPDSIIMVNRRDKRLVANACYVIADETGSATYKRYRPNDNPPFQPASYDDIEAPTLTGAISVIGRVRRSIIDM